MPDEEFVIPFGEARKVCEGNDVTIVAFSRMVLFKQAAKELSSEGISVEVIDPRTLSPLDDKSIIDSVEKTGKLLIVDEANPIVAWLLKFQV